MASWCRTKPTKREFTLKAGKGEIEVFEKDGIKLATKQFELTRNGKTTVRVTYQELAEARKPQPKIEPEVSPKSKQSILYLYDLEASDVEVLEGRFKKGWDANGVTVKGKRFKKGLWMHPFADRKPVLNTNWMDSMSPRSKP